MRLLFSQFGATYFTRVTYINRQIPNIHFVYFSTSSFEIFIVSFLFPRIFVPFLIGQHSCHIIIQYSSVYCSRTRSIFRLPSFCVLVLRCHGTGMLFSRCFPFCLRLGTLTPPSKWYSDSVNRSSASTVLALPVCRQFHLLCQPSLTFYSTS